MEATIILLILAGVFKAIMDTLQFHWPVSIFSRWASKPTALADLIRKWAGPDSWKNKNLPQNPIIRFLTRGPLVFLTDAWHFFQFLYLTSIQAAIIIHLPLIVPSPFWSFIIHLALAKVIMGIAFEVFWAHLLLSPINIRRLPNDDHKFTFWDYYKTLPKLIGNGIIVLGFAGCIFASMLGAPMMLVVLGVIATFLLMIYLYSRSKA